MSQDASDAAAAADGAQGPPSMTAAAVAATTTSAQGAVSTASRRGGRALPHPHPHPSGGVWTVRDPVGAIQAWLRRTRRGLHYDQPLPWCSHASVPLDVLASTWRSRALTEVDPAGLHALLADHQRPFGQFVTSTARAFFSTVIRRHVIPPGTRAAGPPRPSHAPPHAAGPPRGGGGGPNKRTRD